MTVKFKNWVCEVVKTKYVTNNRIALQLFDTEDGCLCDIGTTNLPDEHLEDGEVIVDGNIDGMYQCLVENKVVSPAKRYVKSGYVSYPVCDILI